MDRKTALYETHIKYGGKMVSFAGYSLPVQYKDGIIKEHLAVRNNVGIFDVSHMGEILCSGTDATANLQNLLTNDFSLMPVGRARYSPMCNEKGGCVDDLIVYKYRDDTYLIVVNASNRHKDFEWMQNHKFGNVIFEDISDTVSQIALQGPDSIKILHKLIKSRIALPRNYFAEFDINIGGIQCILSATGYTGETGYEIYLPNDKAEEMWEMLMYAGAEFNISPCGLGARDTLRLEASMPLFGHEISDDITPLESALSAFVKMDKPNFIGKSALQSMPVSRVRVGLKAIGKGIIREHQNIYFNNANIGKTTSGTYCPYIGYPAAMALVDINHSSVGMHVNVDVRGRMVEAEIVELPFYKKPN